MNPKTRKKLAETLQRWLGRLLRPYNALEHAARVEQVGDFLYQTMPQADPETFHERLVVMEGSVGINFFQLPSGDVPRFNFVILELGLYVLVADVRSASWPEARARGIARGDWEAYQNDLAEVLEEVPNLPYVPGAQPRPLVLLVRWDEPVGATSLHTRLNTLLRSRTQ